MNTLIEWHAIYTENGTVKDCTFIAVGNFEEAEEEFRVLHPNATRVELGRPLVEVRVE
jgi:hypothetical protein